MPPLDENEGFVVKVKYADNFIDLKKGNWKEADTGDGIDITHSSAPILFKDSYWSFQDEIRYYLLVSYKHTDRAELPENFDIPINETAFRSIKIRLYPNYEKEDKELVKEIIADNLPYFDSTNIIEESELQGKYKPKT